MQWANLFFISPGDSRDIVRRTPAIDVDYWLPIEFNIIADRPIILKIEADKAPDMQRAEIIMELPESSSLVFPYDLRVFRFVRGAFHIPGNCNVEIWVKGWHT